MPRKHHTLHKLTQIKLVRFAQELEIINANLTDDLKLLEAFAKDTITPDTPIKQELVDQVREYFAKKQRLEGRKYLGRPPILTPEVRWAFEKLLAEGEKIEVAARYFGIGYSTALRWARIFKRTGTHYIPRGGKIPKIYKPTESVETLRQKIVTEERLDNDLDPIAAAIAEKLRTSPRPANAGTGKNFRGLAKKNENIQSDVALALCEQAADEPLDLPSAPKRSWEIDPV